MIFYKYQGAGNDFLIADNRDGSINMETFPVAKVCDRRYGIGADGLMLLESSEDYDFRMTYFNSDGSGGMMCGNGGRCIVAFAADMGLTHFDFEAADGFHTAEILKEEGGIRTVRLKMKDVSGVMRYDALDVDCPSDGFFLDTGTRHYVRFVDDVTGYDVVAEGRKVRYAPELSPIGANVNFVEPYEGGIRVRTYEKGVEDETFACGTGIVASAIASYVSGIPPIERSGDHVRYAVRAKRDDLAVEFNVSGEGESLQCKDVWLVGPAQRLAEIRLLNI